MKHQNYTPLILLTAGTITIFITRTILAASYDIPRLNDLFTIMTVLGAFWISIKNFKLIQPHDWAVAIGFSLLVGIGMNFATLFTPYPFLGIIKTNLGQAFVRGLSTTIALLGALAIMRQGGPVSIHLANGEWKKAVKGLLIGLGIGLPFSVLNAFALQISEGQAIQWQSPLAAGLDALQPALVEEAIYRFTLWGLLWLLLNRSMDKKQADWASGLLALLIHNYIHFDDLWLQSPIFALGFGAVILVVWGLPHTFLAYRRGLESSIAFHWFQDFTRFLAGF